MRYSEALEIVHSLAEQNQIDEVDVEFGDEGLSSQRAWQQEAIDTLGDLIANQADEIDTRYAAVPLIDVAAEDVVADRSSDASRPQAAIRVCLDLAEQNVLDDPEMQDEVDRQELALKTVENFIVAHGDALDASMTTLRM